ncbi:hypothetical protein [Clostridium novyi]|uniref:hypothetical protein n=1 Tax=Clostridium novyi TaxID=1542 RepID=UPI000AFD9D59|nr:hypothetical protein [Clostridium novyi]
MDKLEPLEREIISRYYIDDESFRKIAEDKKLLYDRARYLRRRVIRKLRGMLEKKIVIIGLILCNKIQNNYKSCIFM